MIFITLTEPPKLNAQFYVGHHSRENLWRRDAKSVWNGKSTRKVDRRRSDGQQLQQRRQRFRNDTGADLFLVFSPLVFICMSLTIDVFVAWSLSLGVNLFVSSINLWEFSLEAEFSVKICELREDSLSLAVLFYFESRSFRFFLKAFLLSSFVDVVILICKSEDEFKTVCQRQQGLYRIQTVQRRQGVFLWGS